MDDTWKILRILTTNRCNYRCLYCHNEGQEKIDEKSVLSIDNFYKITEAINGMGFQEIRFSGGEPLSNPRTVEMIEWMDSNTDYEIGLATNGSLINEEIAERLGKTRTLVTLHFPAIDEDEYKRITGMQISGLINAIGRLERNNVKHSFNFVLYPDTISNISDVIEHVIKSGKRVKLLPYIEESFNNFSESIIEDIKKKASEQAISKTEFSAGGITTWEYEGGGKVKLLDSPCYDHSIDRCREYGELRLLPDFSLQKCIFSRDSVSIKGMTVEEIREVISELWQSFNTCIKR
jgi:cyclic pyranopterin phosphate synthase